ncbi:MAG: hypothetical protein BWK80_61395 [Desulfobacteraceae bacterium IS3]|nr:MAG: hypothetical protein BWK80_61395 [Desulfobacteraceae bacterium IS3]
MSNLKSLIIFGNNQQISRKDRKERKAEENCRTDNISLYSFASSAPFARDKKFLAKNAKVAKKCRATQAENRSNRSEAN